MKRKKLLGMTVLLTVTLAFTGCSARTNSNQKETNKSENSAEMETSGAVTEKEVSYITIETDYIPLKYPEANSESLEYEQQKDGDTTTIVFSMRLDEKDTKLELFRISFGDEQAEEFAGTFKTDDGYIPVTYTFASYTQEELANLEATDQYYAMVDGFNSMLNALGEDERFIKDQNVDMNDTAEMKLDYWTIILPKVMECEEMTEGESYQADFYGTVSGEKVKLYSVRLGNEDVGTVIGTYLVDDTEKTVSVESYELQPEDGWTDADLMAAGSMMDTINDVIQTITADKNFSAEN